jgi:hypothetical protein
MKKDDPDYQRHRVLFAYTKLSTQIRSDVFSDGSIATRFALPMTRPLRLSDNLVISNETLFAAFRCAVDGKPIPAIIDANNTEISAKVSIAADGTGIVEIGDKGWRFAHAALLSGDTDRRLVTLESALHRHTIAGRYAAELRALVAKADYSDEDFVETVRLLSSSPEAFAGRLRDVIAKREIGEAHLLPDDIRYWDHLAAPVGKSATLAEFIVDELETERRARLSLDPIEAYKSISLTFAAPGLVPRELFKSLEADVVLRIVDAALRSDDHFALVGGFEICSDWVGRDARFTEPGDRLLDRLFASQRRIEGTCRMFAAAFIIATAHLAVHDVLRSQPVYWRRLVAASHASLIVRTCGITDDDYDEVISWATRLRGEEYLLSVFCDMAIEPQWRPEWAESRFLTADVFGRAYGAFLALPEAIAPESWRTRLTTAKVWIDADDLNSLMSFPAVLEGARRARIPAISELGETIAEAYGQLSREPSIEMLLRLTPALQAYGVPEGVNISARQVVAQIRNGTDGLDDPVVQAALSLLGHIAILAKDTDLADAVAETCVEMVLAGKEQRSLYEAVFRLVECAAANPDREAARSVLAKRLELLAFRLPVSERMTSYVWLLEVLRKVMPEIAPLLGRAVAAAKLGVPRGAAAC